jgi:CheY-like chemotaxis protein
VVLCDLGLPAMSGYEVAQALRAEPALRGVRLVALSGYALPEDVQRALSAGFDRHMAKPPDLDALQALVAELPEIECGHAAPAASAEAARPRGVIPSRPRCPHMHEGPPLAGRPSCAVPFAPSRASRHFAALRASAGAARPGLAAALAARSSSQMVIGAAMNQVE